ncbi:MAG TPA: hypothetical protein VFL64_04700 [Rhizobacter sp.]|nr:hypothetical protein [Rhizobacter sp.]
MKDTFFAARTGLAFGTFAVLAWAAPARATPEEDAELQKKLSNPVADIVTIPLQLNINFDSGPYEKTQYTLNVQPVFPVKLGDSGWSLINRVILPILSNPATAPGQERKNGIGDVLYQGFLSPAPHGLIWGVGPALQLKTASNDRLGSGKWAAGPTAVALKQEGPWSVGTLATQIWSFAGSDDRADVNQLQLQPILSYSLSPTHSIAYSGIVIANWDQPSSQRWLVPLGATYSILTRPGGGNPINYVFGGGYNVVRPDDAARWALKLQVNFVLPK